jgi:hypothetical protein
MIEAYTTCMLGLTNTNRRHTARGLLVLLLGMWTLAAAAPCVMASPSCPDMAVPCPSMDQHPAAQPEAPPCDTLQAVDCQTRDAAWLVSTATTPDFTALPPRLFLQPPAALVPTQRHSFPQVERYALRLSPPPLYLQHTVFLI